jgi:hypothetical protein
MASLRRFTQSDALKLDKPNPARSCFALIALVRWNCAWWPFFGFNVRGVTYGVIYFGKGGLTIDYIKPDGSLNSGKVEPSALQNSLTLHSTLMQSSELIGLVDSRSEFTDATVPKELMPQLAMNRKGAPAISGDQVQQQPVVPTQPLTVVPPAAPTSMPAPATPAPVPAPVANPAPAAGGFFSEASKSQPDYGEDQDNDEEESDEDEDDDDDDDDDGGDDDGDDEEDDDEEGNEDDE